MSEVYDATQILLVTGKCCYLIGSISITAAIQIAKVLNTIYLSKWRGKTSLNRFRNIKGDDFTFINVRSEDLKILAAIEKEMEAHGILLAKLPDLCGGDQNTQYVISPSDAAKFKAFLLDHTHGAYKNVRVGVIQASDYANTAVRSDGVETPEFQTLAKSAYPQLAMKEPAGLLERKGAQTLDKRVSPQLTAKALAGLLERKELEIKLHDAAAESRKVSLIEIAQPIKEHKNWAMYRMPDGERAVLVPKRDILENEKNQMAKVILFQGQDYMVVNLKSGEQLLASGKQVETWMEQESIEQRKQRLSSKKREIRKRQDGSITRIFVKASLIQGEQADGYKTRVPYTDQYVIVPKEDSFWDDSKKNLTVFLKDEMDYKVTDQSGMRDERIPGTELKKNYYIKADAKTERYPFGEAHWKIEEKNSLGLTKVLVEMGAYQEAGERYIVKLQGTADEYIKIQKNCAYLSEKKELLLFLKNRETYSVIDQKGKELYRMVGTQLMDPEKWKRFGTDRGITRHPDLVRKR